jgi:hypothetical protein
MLKSYEVSIEGDRITWLGERPNLQTTCAIIVIADKNKVTPIKRRSPSKAIAGKGRTLGDIVSPIVDKEDWECLK